MPGYRHGCHAGNFADVHKHLVLSLLVRSLQRADRGLFYLDTHAGAGAYDLHSVFASRGEHRQGIARVLARSDVPPLAAAYLDAVRAFDAGRRVEPGPELRFYPGSPCLVRAWLRPQDRMVLTELHPNEAPMLQAEFRGDPQVAVHRQDAYEALKAFLPPPVQGGLWCSSTPPTSEKTNTRSQ